MTLTLHLHDAQGSLSIGIRSPSRYDSLLYMQPELLTSVDNNAFDVDDIPGVINWGGEVSHGSSPHRGQHSPSILTGLVHDVGRHS